MSIRPICGAALAMATAAPLNHVHAAPSEIP